MSADLEREAREKLDNEAAIAATKADRQWNATLGPQTRAHYRSGFRDGYRNAATLREKEIEELRALLREACGILNDAIKTDETFWLEEMRGTNEDLTERIMLMLPPTPVPETKVNASQQGA